MRPVNVKYVNFRATLPVRIVENEDGEEVQVPYGKDEVRLCMGYKFEAGVYERRLTESQARVAHNVLTKFFGCSTEDVPDVYETETSAGSENSAQAGETVVEAVGGNTGASAERQPESGATVGNKPTKAKARRSKRKASKNDSKQRSDSNKAGQPKQTDTQLTDDLA